MTVKIEIDRQQYARINRILNKIPQQMQFAAYDKALKPAAQVVQKRAEELAPRSTDSGSRKKMSKKSQDTWPTQPLASLLKIKVIKGKGKSDPYALAGPDFPKGNKATLSTR